MAYQCRMTAKECDGCGMCEKERRSCPYCDSDEYDYLYIQEGTIVGCTDCINECRDSYMYEEGEDCWND